MKLTESMIRDWVNTSLSAEEISDLLTMTGFEIEEIVSVEGEPMLDVNIMANRGDGASVRGLAREILAKSTEHQPTENWKNYSTERDGFIAHTNPTPFKIDIQTENCTRFCALLIEDVVNGESPDWLQKRLRQIGQKPISLLVDLANYVMFEIGQPLHTYDSDKLTGDTIIIRESKKGETLTTLDEEERKLEDSMMMICDGSGIIGIAGVMGGATTEASSETKNCLLESAHFVNTSVRATRTKLGMHTEASYRFERSVDPEFCKNAIIRFAELYSEITGEEIKHSIVDVYPSKPEQKELSVKMQKANDRLGMDVPTEDAKGYLTRLGCNILSEENNTLKVSIPSWRIDLQREEDLIEEIGRMHGYEKIPDELPIGSTPVGGVHGFEKLQEVIRESVLLSGFDQMLSHTMRSLHPLDAQGDRIKVRTPHSPEIENLRNSLLPCLAEACLKNGGDNVHLFEMGKVFCCGKETVSLALLSSGKFEGETWLESDKSQADFYSLKGVLEDLASHIHANFSVNPSQDARLHPTRQASIQLNGISCGVFGQIHPDISEESNLKEYTVLAELNISELESLKELDVSYQPISRQPAIRRDLSIVVNKETPFAQIQKAIQTGAGESLEDSWLFDVYDGKGIEDGQHSLAIAMILRKMDATFTDEEANLVRDSVVQELAKLGATIR